MTRWGHMPTARAGLPDTSHTGSDPKDFETGSKNSRRFSLLQFTFGSDPEFCLQSPDGQLLSAIDRVADTDLSLRGATMFPDNVLVELNIPPGKSASEFQGYLRQTLTDAARMVAPNRLVAQAAAVYPDSEMQHRKAHVFGCDPEFDAWKMEYGVPTEVDRPKPADNLRTCGGHIHI